MLTEGFGKIWLDNWKVLSFEAALKEVTYVVPLQEERKMIQHEKDVQYKHISSWLEPLR